MSESLYNLAPWWRLLLTGLVLAALPLGWLLLRHRGLRALQALTGVTLFLTLDLVMFGAFTRLTDSGLGCPDWPGCYGFGSPLGAQTHIDLAQAAWPTGPVSQGKAWIEMLHRYMATAVGALILALTLWNWGLHLRARRSGQAVVTVRWWASLTLVWVMVQGAFGALTVTMKLFPAIVSLHLLGGMALLGLLSVQLGALSRPASGAGRGGWAWALGGMLVLLFLQMGLGAWVSTNYAVLACNEFPRCQGGWWPAMNFADGFSLWHALGVNASGEMLDFSALTAIHYSHRLAAYAVLAALWLLAWQARARAGLRRPARALFALSLLQLGTGLGNVLLGWPLLSAVLHTGGAAGLLMCCVWLWHAAAAGLPASQDASRELQ